MNVVWDFGGVLFQWRPPELLKRALPRHATDDETAARWVREFFQGYGGDWGEFDRGALDVPALVARIAARTGLPAADVRRVVDGVPAELQPIAESVALLARLRAAGHRQFFLSNMPAPYADHLEREHDFVRWFDDGVFSARVQAVKPEADIFALAARRFGCAPGELLFFDDHGPNVEAARAAGWHAHHFDGAAGAAAALRGHGLL